MKTLCLLSVSSLALVAAPLAAQTPPASATPAAAAEDEATTIVVTGSRIPRPQFEGTIPGVQLTAQEFQARGFSSVLEALNDLPLVGPGASPNGNAGGQPASLGASFVDLLDLGTNRTLSLVNGRRFVSGNAGTLFVQGNTTGGQVDLNVIPTELVERTDVLTVGGAVAYGSDAIAGVVNIILKDNFEGLQANVRAGITSRGDTFNGQASAIWGSNFADGRGNVAISFQYNRDDGLYGDARPAFANTYIAPTFFGNGNRRNPAFAPGVIDVTNSNNGAFLRATDDGQPGNRFLPLVSGGSILLSDGGNVFQYTGTQAGFPTAFSAVVAGRQAGAAVSVAGATQAVPGGPLGAAQAVGNPATLPPGQFTRFAPNALPSGVTAAQVITALAPGFNAAALSDLQRNTLAINLLQANRPTPREFLAQNPNTPINAFLGTLVPAFLDIPNPDAASAQALPRTAVPLRFDGSGALVPFTPGVFNASTPATLGGMPGGDFLDQSRFTTLRAQQDRYIGNLIAHFDLTPNIRLYTENLFAKVDSAAPRNIGSSNSLALGGTENAVIVASITNPYLSTAARNTLVAAGIDPATGVFALSRTNQDVTGDTPAFAASETYRSVLGLKGDFEVGTRRFTWDVAGAYGKSKATITTTNIRDVEYALALDAVVDPANPSRIVCRIQTPGASTALPLGITNTVLVREARSDGVLVERLVPRAVTASQISGCAPLNPFGFNQMSQASKDYTTFTGVARNQSEQYYINGSIASAALFDLPGGGIGFALNAEWRRDTLDYRPSEEQRLGVSRTAALAATRGEVTSMEASAELRIPIFGEEFTLPMFRNLEFTPGVRFVKQNGNAPDVLRLNGNLETNEAKGKWNTLYTLGGAWRPVEGVLVRGNYTRSLRQPSVVELFLGNQPAFNTPTDPCGNAQISGGNVPATRRANCEQEVVRLGIAPDRASAANFLNSFVPAGQNLQGGFSGSPALKPEEGSSWTVGGVLSPKFAPGLVISADYINVTVRNQIIPTTLSNAAQFCYDSPTYNDTSGTLGVNTCSFFDREPSAAGGTPQFNIRNGFASGFINLGALRVKSVNGSAEYRFDLADLFGGEDKGNLRIRANVYHLISYISSAAGTFADSQESAGSFFRPKWETQLTGRYEKDGFFFQWTWNWQNKTRIFNFNTGAFNTPEQQDVIDLPAVGRHDASIGYRINDNFELQFNAFNIFSNEYAGLNGLANGSQAVGNQGEIDYFGRRYRLTARIKF
ncbi:TonB-dependent receptor domain-containing protein [Sandaracinobacteroides saxicola]|uniref:TonB-dependent receptor n=1 Tax=Sandaracinobacteroides saxicola TaxID=2759707 RepID=A0A7G5ILB7_9SPHN|nr:TonB-dependent receptor [Sandaracinobacteroides saxicola]QMW24159.1 TonB-dependent receptor [Sandaracinobacteroides saxicola]